MVVLLKGRRVEREWCGKRAKIEGGIVEERDEAEGIRRRGLKEN